MIPETYFVTHLNVKNTEWIILKTMYMTERCVTFEPFPIDVKF